MAPLLSPRLFKLFIAAAEDVRPLAMEFLAALKRKDEAEVRRLKPILDARLEKWDRVLAKAYNDPAQRSLFKRVWTRRINEPCLRFLVILYVEQRLRWT